jgi:hypothetical protein
MDSMHCKGLSPTANRGLHGKTHPLTGELLVPLGLRKNGEPIWPFMGGSGEGAEGDEGTGGEESDKDADSKDKEGSGNSSEDKEGDEKKDKPEKGSLEARLAALEDEKERQYSRRKEAETRAETAERELRELKEKDLPETEKLTTRVTELESDNTVLNDALLQSRLEIAFLKDNTYEWHNPGRALQVADLSRVEVDKDGSVKGLSDALEALAKSDPYLIKTEEKTSDADKDAADKKDKDKPVKTGDQKNGSAKDKGDAGSKRRAELVERYPGLRR